jgi:hypothetical protein
MKFASTGTTVASRSRPRNSEAANARGADGFTLIEGLVALTLLLVFVESYEPLLSQARRLLVGGSGQVEADNLLRSLLDNSFNRDAPDPGTQEGLSNGMAWEMTTRPDEDGPPAPAANFGNTPVLSKDHRPDWALYRVHVSVSWGNNRSIAADSLRLGIRSNNDAP